MHWSCHCENDRRGLFTTGCWRGERGYAFGCSLGLSLFLPSQQVPRDGGDKLYGIAVRQFNAAASMSPPDLLAAAAGQLPHATASGAEPFSSAYPTRAVTGARSVPPRSPQHAGTKPFAIGHRDVMGTLLGRAIIPCVVPISKLPQRYHAGSDR